MKRGDYIFIFLSFFLSLSQIGCFQEKPKTESPAELIFNVDKSLLAPQINKMELSFAFSPPSGWEKLPDKIIRKAKQKANKTVGTDLKDIEMLYGFMDKSSDSVFTVAKISSLKQSSPSTILGEYKNTITANDKTAEVHLGSYIHNTFTVHQLLSVSSSTVSFKLIFAKSALPHAIQIDFVFPKEVYPRFIKTVESVIGSFKPEEVAQKNNT